MPNYSKNITVAYTVTDGRTETLAARMGRSHARRPTARRNWLPSHVRLTYLLLLNVHGSRTGPVQIRVPSWHSALVLEHSSRARAGHPLY